MNAVSAGTLVHLIFIDPTSHKKSWFVRTDRRQTVSKVYQTWPLVDDDPRQSKPVTYDFAIVAQRRWREELNLVFRLSLEPNGKFIDEEIIPPPTGPWPHQDALVTVDAEGNLFDSPDATHVFLVRAVRTPQGPMFCLRFETGILQNQSQYSTIQEGPEGAVRKAIERGFTKIERPRPNPYLESRRREAERQAAQQAGQKIPNLRPGDRT
jgi:hypothetical protein